MVGKIMIQSRKFQEKKEDIWLSPMANAPTPTEKLEKKLEHKNIDYTTNADRFRSVGVTNNIFFTNMKNWCEMERLVRSY